MNRAVDVLATKLAIAEGQELLLRERNVTGPARADGVGDAPALEETIDEQIPIVGGDLRSVASEDPHRRVHEPVLEITARDDDFALHPSSGSDSSHRSHFTHAFRAVDHHGDGLVQATCPPEGPVARTVEVGRCVTHGACDAAGGPIRHAPTPMKLVPYGPTCPRARRTCRRSKEMPTDGHRLPAAMPYQRGYARPWSGVTLSRHDCRSERPVKRR